ncbi:MAG: ATP-binding protein [Anaerolineaceae bacterium]|nr:ATP-binding protein [Anaerolineaceae bacterium]
MLSQSTDTVLRAMRLTGMANELERQNADTKLVAALSFDERLSLIVDAEWRKRQNSKMKRFVNDACLPIKRAQVEDIEYHPDRKLDKAKITQLAACSYIDQGLHIIIHGASGNGKTYLGCALGNAACRRFKKTFYIRMQELLERLKFEKDNGDYRKYLNSLKKLDLLILDEFLLRKLTPEEASHLLEVVEIRSRNDDGSSGRSTIFCTQYEPSDWYERISPENPEQDPETEAIIDRIVHSAHVISVEGKYSMRQRHGLDAPDEVSVSVKRSSAEGGALT